MAAKDRLLNINVRARAEGVRMLYSLSGTPYEDDRVPFADWDSRKAETPNGQGPVLYTPDGNLNQSSSIGRYAAKRFGMMGKTLWEEALHDMITENVSEGIDAVIKKVYAWKYAKREPEPENPDKVYQEVKVKWQSILEQLQKVAEKRGKKFIVSDEIGLAEIWLYTAMQLAEKAIPDIMSLTEWGKKFAENFSADERVKKHMESRLETDHDL